METTSLLNEKQLFALLENSYEAIFLLDEGLNPIYKSPSAYQITGYSREEHKQKNFIGETHPRDIEKVTCTLENALANPGRSFFITFLSRHKKGHYIILEGVFINHLQNEDLKAIVCNLRDVTSRIETEETLQRKTKQIADYKYAIDQSSIVAVTDPKGIIRFVNDNFCKISKYSNEELKGQDQRIIISEYHSAKFVKEIWRTIATGKVWKGEIKNKAKDGSYYWTDTTIVPFMDEEGKPLQYMAIRTDITEKKKSEEQVNKMVCRLQQAQETARVGSWEVNFASGKAIWSDEACRIYGIPGENVQTFESWISFIHPEDQEKVTRIVKNSELTLKGASFRHRIVLKNGTIKNIHSISRFEFDAEGRPVNLIGTCRDITASIKAKEELKSNEEKFRNVFENSPIGKSITTMEGKLRTNKALCDILGYTREELQEMNWKNITYVDDIKKGEEEAKSLLNGEKSIASFEKRYLHKNGSIVFSDIKLSLLFDKCNKPQYFIASIIDITERKRSAENLLKSEANLTAIIENADAYVYSIDREFRYLTFNNFLKTTLKNLYGFEIKKGDKVFEFLEKTQPEEAKWYENMYTEALKGGAVRVVKEYKRDAKSNFSLFSINPIRENGIIIGLSCFVRDITKEKKAEQVLIDSEAQTRNFARHLSRIQEEERARIAREIHDELGQQLVGIKIGLSALVKPETGGIVNGIVKEVDDTLHCVRKIATELRPGILDSLGLIPSIKWLGKEFERKTSISCKIDLNIPEKQFDNFISIACFRICQEALTNISKHAGATEVKIKMEYNTNLLLLNIEDNGKGIVNEKLENPFSMGLLGMRERANLIGGELQIESKKGRGTNIKLSILMDQLC